MSIINKFKLAGHSIIDTYYSLNITQYILLKGDNNSLNKHAYFIIKSLNLQEYNNTQLPVLIINTIPNKKSIISIYNKAYELIFHQYHNINTNYKLITFDDKWLSIYNHKIIYYNDIIETYIDECPDVWIDCCDNTIFNKNGIFKTRSNKKYNIDKFIEFYNLRDLDKGSKLLVFGIDFIPTSDEILYVVWTRYDYNELKILDKIGNNIVHLVLDKNLVYYFIERNLIFYTLDIEIYSLISINIDDNFFLNASINQIYISDSLVYLNRIANKYNLSLYTENLPNKGDYPLLVFGLLTSRDFEIINRHNRPVYLLWHGNDCNDEFKDRKNNLNIFSKNYKHIISISSNRLIYNKLLQYNIDSILIENLNIVNYDYFTPFNFTKETKYVYVYNGYTKGLDKYYEDQLIDLLVKLAPEFNYMFSNSVGLQQYNKMADIYRKCFIGVRLTKFGGMFNQVREMLSMEIPVVCNGVNGALSWSNLNDVREHIINCYKKTPKYIAEKNKEYLVFVSNINLNKISIQSIWLINTINTLININNNVVLFINKPITKVEGLSQNVKIVTGKEELDNNNLLKLIETFCVNQRVKKIFIYHKDFLKLLTSNWIYLPLSYIYVNNDYIDIIKVLNCNYKSLITYNKTCYNFFLENGIKNINYYITPKKNIDANIIIHIGYLNIDTQLKKILNSNVSFINIIVDEDIEKLKSITYIKYNYQETLKLIENSLYFYSDQIEYEFFGLKYYNNLINKNIDSYFNSTHFYVLYRDDYDKLKIVSYLNKYFNIKYELIQYVTYDKFIDKDFTKSSNYNGIFKEGVYKYMMNINSVDIVLENYSKNYTFTNILNNSLINNYDSIIILDSKILIHKEFLERIDYNTNISNDIIYFYSEKRNEYPYIVSDTGILINNNKDLFKEIIDLLATNLPVNICFGIVNDLYKYYTYLPYLFNIKTDINYIYDNSSIENYAFLTIQPLNGNISKIPWDIFVINDSSYKEIAYYYLCNNYTKIVFLDDNVKIVSENGGILFFNKKYQNMYEFIEDNTLEYNGNKIDQRVFVLEKLIDYSIYYISFANGVLNSDYNYDIIKILKPYSINDLDYYRGSKYICNRKLSTPHLSIIIPTYNGITYICETIDSIFEQSYKDFELIIVDDCSNDSSDILILGKYSDQRIVYIKNRINMGLVESLNLGIKTASGKYITWLSNTHYYKSDNLESLLTSSNADIIYNSCVKCSDISNLEFLLNRSNITNIVFKKTVIDKIGYFDVDYADLLNYEFICRAIKHKLTWSFYKDIIIGLLCQQQIKYSLIKLYNNIYNYFLVDNILDIQYFYIVDTENKSLHYYHLAYSLLSKNIDYNIVEYFRLSQLYDNSFLPAVNNYQFLTGNNKNGLIYVSLDTIINNNLISFPSKQTNTLPKNNIKISIIIYSYNNNENTAKCLQNLNVHANDIEIIILNNGNDISYYNTPNTKIINSDALYTLAINSGVNNASGDFIILLTNNIVCNGDNWYNLLVEPMLNNADIFGVIPAVNYSYDDSCVSLYHNSITEYFNKYELVKSYYNSKTTKYYNNCIAMRRQEFIDIGMFDTNYKYTLYDLDLCNRIADGRILINYNVCVYNLDKNINKYLLTDSNYYRSKWQKNEMVDLSNNNIDYDFIFDSDNISLKDYIHIDNTIQYIETNSKLNVVLDRFKKIEKHENRMEVDIFFYKLVNNLNIDNIYNHLYNKGIYEGLIYHPNQIKNSLKTDFNIKVYNNNQLFINYNGLLINVKHIVNNIYKTTYIEHISNITIKDSMYTDKNSLILIIVFIGYLDGGLILLDYLTKYKIYVNSKFILGICFRNLKLYEEMCNLVIENFTNYTIFISNEYGNDIIPSLQVFNYYQKFNFEYIIKLHTKSDINIFKDHLEYLLSTSTFNLLKDLEGSNISCHKKYRNYVKNDYSLCQHIIQKYVDHLDIDRYYSSGTMFFTSKELFNSICNFIQNNNYSMYFNNNMYDSNVINYYNSPIHFLERLFGILRVNYDHVELFYKKLYRAFCINSVKLFNIKIPNNTNKIINTVFIEFRELESILFNIKNCIYKFSNNVSYTIVCGNKNYNYIKYINNQLNNLLIIIKLDYDNVDRNTYNNLLLTTNFWNNLIGEKVLIYQDDSIIYKSNINDFIEYDYIGAPWPHSYNENRNNVGNGGFSLRTRKACIDVLNRHPNNNLLLDKVKFSKNTLEFIKNGGLDHIPEDVYYSTLMIELGYKVATYDVAEQFSTELTYNLNSLGGHCPWLYYLRNGMPYIFETNITRIFRCSAVASPYDYTIGGGELYISQIVRQLLNLDYIVLFFSITKDLVFNQTIKNYLTPIEIERLVLLDYNLLLKTELLDEFNLDYFIVMENSVLPSVRGIGKTNIYHCQFPNDYYQPPTDISILNNYKYIIVNSEFTRQWYDMTTKQQYSDKLFIVYPPCGNTNIKKNIIKQSKTFVMLGRIFKRGVYSNNKHFDVAIDLFSKIDDDYKLTIIGSVKDIDYYDQLRKSIKYPHRIQILTDVDDGVKNYWLMNSEYYIQLTGFMEGKPSNEEHFGISLVEAVKFGCIPICYNGGYAPYLVKHNINGYLINNVDDLQKLLLDILSSKKAKPAEKIEILKFSSDCFFKKMENFIF
jgi:hypothetical protein